MCIRDRRATLSRIYFCTAVPAVHGGVNILGAGTQTPDLLPPDLRKLATSLDPRRTNPSYFDPGADVVGINCSWLSRRSVAVWSRGGHWHGRGRLVSPIGVTQRSIHNVRRAHLLIALHVQQQPWYRLTRRPHPNLALIPPTAELVSRAVPGTKKWFGDSPL